MKLLNDLADSLLRHTNHPTSILPHDRILPAQPSPREECGETLTVLP